MKIKGLLIDPFAKTVTKVEVERNNNEDIYKLIDCDTFDVAHLSNGDVCFVDDEGTFPGHCEQDGVKHGFMLPGFPHALVGKGLILGADYKTGNNVDMKTPTGWFKIAFFKLGSEPPKDFSISYIVPK